MTFQEIDGVAVHSPDRELAEWIISLSAGTTPEELAARIRRARVQPE